MRYFDETYSFQTSTGVQTINVLHTAKDCKRIKGSLTGPMTAQMVITMEESTRHRVLCQTCGVDPEFLRRKHQVQDAMNRCKDIGVVEKIARLLNV